MANSQFEYVKHFEQQISLLRDTFIVVRIDGRGFHKLAANLPSNNPLQCVDCT